MSQIITYKCDLCEFTAAKGITPKTVPVLFLTDQTEGRSVKPYLLSLTIETCDQCFSRIKDAQPLTGSGAMGHNTYTWREQK